MNYFNKAEKTLKSCLKEKLSITTATVVGFLIAGTVAFGAPLQVEEGDTVNKITQEKVSESTGTVISGENKTVINVSGKNSIEETLVNDSKIENAGWLVTVNNGDLTIGEGVTLKGDNLTRTTINLYGDTNTTNNGTIEKAQNGWAAVTIAAPNSNSATFTNNGTVDGAMNIEGSVTLNNTGKITGDIYSDNSYSNTDAKIVLSGNSDITSIKLKGEKGTLTINDNTDTIEELTGLNKITINNSTITVKGGEIKADTVASSGIVDVINSNLDTAMNIIGTGDAKSNDVLINNYGTKEGTYNLINRGNLTSTNVQNGIYTNAGTKTSMNVTNEGAITIGNGTKWVTGLNGKFDSKVENASLTITNNGKVVVKNGAGIDITNNGADSNKGLAINGENGYIEIQGFGVGILAEGKGVEGINNGTIVMKDSVKSSEKLAYGMQAKDGASITNNGTIILDYNSPTQKDGESTDRVVKALGVEGEGSTATNNGKIKLNDIAKGTDTENWDKDTILSELGVTDKGGMVVDKYGVNIFDKATQDEIGLDGGETTVADLEKAVTENNANGIVISSLGGTIKASKTEDKEDILTADYMNVNGVLNIATGESDATNVNIAKTVINLDVNGQIAINEGATLSLKDGVVNGSSEKEGTDDIVIANNSTLTLDGTTVNGNIGTAPVTSVMALDGTPNGATVNVLGESSLVGKIDVATINIGSNVASGITPMSTTDSEVIERVNKFTLSSDSVVGKGKTEVDTLTGNSNTINIEADGQLVLEVGAKGETALGNSTGVNVIGTTGDNGLTMATDTNGDILLSTGNLTGTGIKADLGSGNTFTKTSVSMENGNKGVYVGSVGENNTITLDYNKELFKDNGAINAINNAAMNANNLFENSNLAVRRQQLENIYNGSIYSETVRASYNSVKTFENILRTNNTAVETGKWTAFGNGVYAKDRYDRAGHDSKVETTGLMAGAEYGLNGNTTIGFAFAGANQDVDSITGSADGTTLYLGTYAKKVVGNYKFIAGLGYQYGDYDADNVTGYSLSSDSYKSNAVSAYVEGRYSMDLGSNLTFEPKLKLGYSYIDQDDTKDANIGVSDASLSTFDTEIGADLIKTYALKDGKANLVFGASYVRAFGDTDKDFKGEFVASNGRFDIKGAELAENTGKFDISIEVSKDSGFFYNSGLNLNVGSDDYRNYGVNIGAGYKF